MSLIPATHPKFCSDFKTRLINDKKTILLITGVALGTFGVIALIGGLYYHMGAYTWPKYLLAVGTASTFSLPLARIIQVAYQVTTDRKKDQRKNLPLAKLLPDSGKNSFNVPKEVWKYICSFLNPLDLCQMRRVCKSWRNTVHRVDKLTGLANNALTEIRHCYAHAPLAIKLLFPRPDLYPEYIPEKNTDRYNANSRLYSFFKKLKVSVLVEKEKKSYAFHILTKYSDTSGINEKCILSLKQTYFPHEKRYCGCFYPIYDFKSSIDSSVYYIFKRCIILENESHIDTMKGPLYEWLRRLLSKEMCKCSEAQGFRISQTETSYFTLCDDFF